VASLHRYENIFKEDRFNLIVDRLEQITKKLPIYLVQHPATKEQLEKLPRIKKRIVSNNQIHLLPRLEYLPFIKLVKNSEFVITDGGGNQEELYHMGKPTLLFRDETERQEGIGSTAIISRLDPELIADFLINYRNYRKDPTGNEVSPSKIIADFLQENNFGQQA
jgi:UDP-N-acetylglucosamine 2-epimerase (non-hydrolysing)